MDNGLAELALESAKMEMAMKEKQLYKAAIFEEAQSRPAGFLRRNPVCSERTEVSDSSTPTEAPPAKRAKTQPAPLDKTIKREPLEQPIKREPLDQPIKREPDRPIKTEPLEQPIKTKPLEQPIKREPGADPINTRSKPEPLEKPVKREPDEGTGGVPLNEEAPCRKEEPASTKVDEEPRAKGLDGQADGHASEGLLDQEKPALVKSAAVMSPAEQQALVKGRTEKPRGGAKKKAQPAEDKDEEEEGDEASCAKPKRGPGRPKGSKKKPAEAKAKAKAKASATAKTKPSPKAKAKNQPKAKAKAKAPPSPPGSQDTTYYEQPSKPMKSQKKKTPMKAAVKKATAEEEKKRKSRKSCAYHKTKTLKIREGFSEEEAVRLARIVTCLHHIREPLCTLLDSARFIPLWKHTRPRLMLSKSEFAEAAGECAADTHVVCLFWLSWEHPLSLAGVMCHVGHPEAKPVRATNHRGCPMFVQKIPKPILHALQVSRNLHIAIVGVPLLLMPGVPCMDLSIVPSCDSRGHQKLALKYVKPYPIISPSGVSFWMLPSTATSVTAEATQQKGQSKGSYFRIFEASTV